MEEERPNPDALLKAITREETLSSKGHLKIFLGMAAGVGKTYAMLEAAQKLKAEGLSLVIGTVNTHSRRETEALAQGLPIIPEKKILYKNILFGELDIDEIIKLKPSLAIIDELAHTNVPGSRHPKRWMDVIEILENGIDVYTTLNVQHIESLKDIVESITGIKIRETVPDSIVESATFIELVDLTTSELLQRLKEGKVYLGDKSEIAAKNFFQEDRLTALREVVLRYAAEKVDHDLHKMVSTIEHAERWKAREKLLVAISHSPYSQKLVRTTRRLAFALNAPWIAVYVNDGRTLDETDKNMLAKNLALARDLGGEVIMTNDPDIAKGIQRIARQRGVTQIILGRPPKGLFYYLFQKMSIFDKFAKECTDIDVHIIRQEHTQTRRKRLQSRAYQSQAYSYVNVLLLVLLLTVLNWALAPFVMYKVIGVIFLLGILFLSLFFTKGPVILASIICAFIWEIFFIPSAGRFLIFSDEDSALIALYIITAIATGILVDRAREQKEMLEKREDSTQALYDIARQLATIPSVKMALQTVKEHLSKLFNGTFEIITKGNDGNLEFDNSPSLDEKEKNVALWAFENGKEAGWNSETLSSSQNLYIPLKGFQEIVGIVVYHPKKDVPLNLEEKHFLYTICQQLAYYLERHISEERAQLSEQLKQIEQTYKFVLDRILLVFQPPLLTIENSLKELKHQLSATKNKILSNQVDEIENANEDLKKTITNISVATQLSEGTAALNKGMHSVKEVIDDCCQNLSPATQKNRIRIEIQEDLPAVSFDFYLIELLLFNLLNNAFENSPADSIVEITAEKNGEYVVISVLDEGEGIPDNQLDAIFEKFYRLPYAISPGVGLGLALAKTIAELHQGFIKAENRPDKGTKFSLYLPL